MKYNMANIQSLKPHMLPKQSNLLVLTGWRRVGKDKITERIVERGVKGYARVQRLSFSDMLRLLANDIFPWCPVNPSDEEKDKPILHPDNVLNLSPRQVWLRLADDNDASLRKVDPDILVKRFDTLNRRTILDNPDVLFIITDWRTENEEKWLAGLSSIMDYYVARICDDRTEEERRNQGLAPNDFEAKIDHFRVHFEYEHNRTDESAIAFAEAIDRLYAR
ncbi:hypothetical protein GR28A_00188 [Vibrio phage vB_VcorM_GR28A]|nr:hypothetical protein GR28A_00188 [Vibrio phage vB_VcorM_GR28A]